MSPTADAVLLDASPSFTPVGAGPSGSFAGTPAEPYEIVVVDKVGTVRVALPLASPGDIVETLNMPDEFSIQFPKGSTAVPTYTRDDVDVLGNTGGDDEIQVRLGAGGKVLAWGPAWGASKPDAGTVQLDCRGVDSYFPHRQIDEEPANLLPNGGFESDLSNWRDSGLASFGAGGGTIGVNTSAAVATDVVFEGAKSVRLTGFVPPTGLALASNAFHFTAGPHGNHVVLTFSYAIEVFDFPALYNAGVQFLGGPPGAGPGQGVNAKGVATFFIDRSTPRGVEQRASLDLFVSPNETWAFEVWLYVGTGITVFDNFVAAPHRVLSTAALTGSPAATVDVSRIVQMLALHTLTGLHAKSNLHIGVDAPPIGVKMARAYEFIEHTPLDQALGEFLGRDDCFEYRIVYTKTTRTLVLYPIVDGGMGTDRSADVTLTLGQPPFVSYAPTIDGSGAIDQAVQTGDGSGVTREEQWFTDASRVGGTILQGVGTAAPGARFNSLLPAARALVAQRGQAAEIVEVTISRATSVVAGDPVILQDVLDVGDKVALDIPDGYWTFDGVWRIVRRARHCRPRTMTLTLNKVLA